MAEKKEHHLTRAKRLREEAEARWEVIDTVQEVSEPVKSIRPYRVFDNRAALVAQVNSIEEAEEEVKRFPGGTYRMI